MIKMILQMLHSNSKTNVSQFFENINFKDMKIFQKYAENMQTKGKNIK